MASPRRYLLLHQGADLYGSDRSFISSVKAFVGLVSDSKDVHVILPFYGELSEELNALGVTLEYLPFGVLRKKDLINPVKFFHGLFKSIFFYSKMYRQYDLIYINTVVMLGALLAAAFNFDGRKRVICHVREIPSTFQLVFFRFFLILSRANLIYNSIATSVFFKLPGVVIHNGVPASRAAGPDEFLNVGREALGFVKIVFVGRINSWKGHAMFANALARLPEAQLKNIRVKIVGSPFVGQEIYLTELENVCQRNSLPVEIIPFDKNVNSYYEWCDYVVVPSTKPEPFGRVAIESFSFGKPVIAAGHGGLLEIVDDKINGYIFEPNDIDDLARVVSELLSVTGASYSQMSGHALAKYESSFSEDHYVSEVAGFVSNCFEL